MLKGFSSLEMRFNIQYGMMMESIAFVYNCIQKCSFKSLFDELFYIMFTSAPWRNCVLRYTLAEKLCFSVDHKNVCKSNSHFWCPWHCHGFGGKAVVPSIFSEWEGCFCESYGMLCILNFCPPCVIYLYIMG